MDHMMTSSRHADEVRSRKDHRGADLISDAPAIWSPVVPNTSILLILQKEKR
jgi:hypothetical protein